MKTVIKPNLKQGAEYFCIFFLMFTFLKCLFRIVVFIKKDELSDLKNF